MVVHLYKTHWFVVILTDCLEYKGNNILRLTTRPLMTVCTELYISIRGWGPTQLFFFGIRE